MSCAIFDCPSGWEALLPAGLMPLYSAAEVCALHRELLVLTPAGCRRLQGRRASCDILLLPGGEILPPVSARHVISCGMTSRDSLTFSGLQRPVLCVQRTLPRPDGSAIERQEIPLQSLPGSPERWLPLLGAWLLLGRGGNPFVFKETSNLILTNRENQV